MTTARDIEALIPTDLFKALSDPTRVKLFAETACCGGESNVGDLACCCNVDLSVVSRHLRSLRDAGLVDYNKDGREVRYRVPGQALAQQLRALADALETTCANPDCCCEPG